MNEQQFHEALLMAAEDTCSLHCPSTWRTGERPPHSDRCVSVRAAVSRAAPRAGVRRSFVVTADFDDEDRHVPLGAEAMPWYANRIRRTLGDLGVEAKNVSVRPVYAANSPAQEKEG